TRPDSGRYSLSLLVDHRSIALADFAPAAIQAALLLFFEAAVGILGGHFLIDLDAPTGSFVNVNIAVFQNGAAAKHFLQCRVEGRVLLNAEIGRDQVERSVRHV